MAESVTVNHVVARSSRASGAKYMIPVTLTVRGLTVNQVYIRKDYRGSNPRLGAKYVRIV